MIRVLEKNIADKISAGEVVERPVSVLKELVENSMDAGASALTVEIKNGGKSYIRVTDDGCGIDASDVELAFVRHATSKIRSLADLTRIGTLGFRGEALASIAAVSHVSLITRTEDEKAGVRLVIHGGEIIEKSTVGCPVGTTVTVTDLFYNTPARREFLGTDAAESRMMISLMQEMAICYTDVRIMFINQGDTLFSTKGDGNLKSAIDLAYRKSEYRELISLEHDAGDISVKGCISGPGLSRTNRKDQIFFVNGRPVRSRVLEKGVDEGYRERLFEGRNPVVFMFITTDPATLDVNIHPNKKEIRFHDENRMICVIRDALKEALSTGEAVTKVKSSSDEKFIKPSAEPEEKKTEESQIDIKNILSTIREKSTADSYFEPAPLSVVKDDDNVVNYETQKPDMQPAIPRPFEFTDMQVSGQIFDTYITGIIGQEFFLVDQHAAQERIFYEKLMKEYNGDSKPSQMIMTPILVDVSLSQLETLDPAVSDLEKMGYCMEQFGPNSFRITEIPYFMTIEEAESFLKDFISEYEDLLSRNNKVVADKLITRACKAAIKAHDRLSMEEMQALIRDLSLCDNPFSCPHGRPTFIRFTLYDIEKMFKRV